MGRDGSAQTVSVHLSLKPGTKLAFDELMPETEKLKKNKKEEATISLHSS